MCANVERTASQHHNHVIFHVCRCSAVQYCVVFLLRLRPNDQRTRDTDTHTHDELCDVSALCHSLGVRNALMNVEHAAEHYSGGYRACIQSRHAWRSALAHTAYAQICRRRKAGRHVFIYTHTSNCFRLCSWSSCSRTLKRTHVRTRPHCILINSLQCLCVGPPRVYIQSTGCVCGRRFINSLNDSTRHGDLSRSLLVI